MSQARREMGDDARPRRSKDEWTVSGDGSERDGASEKESGASAEEEKEEIAMRNDAPVFTNARRTGEEKRRYCDCDIYAAFVGGRCRRREWDRDRPD